MKTCLSLSLSRWSALALLAAAACSDNPVAPAYRPEPRLLTSEYACTVDVPTGTTACRETGVGGLTSANVILGTPYVNFVTSYTTSNGNAANEDTTNYSVAIANAIPQPLGTRDGVNADPAGVRLFFISGPTVVKKVSGSGAVAIRLETPDGTATFTNQDGSITYTNKAYFQYSGILATSDTTPSRSMKFIYTSNVIQFSFTYRVSAPAQYEHGWITISPSIAPVLAPAGTTTLTGAVYNQVGVVQADAITWTSSDVAVATVNSSTGQVTGVGEGTATITATSSVNAQRVGTRTIVVDAAPAVTGTSPAASATGVAVTSDVVITFIEAVNVSTSSFTLECPSGWFGTFTVSGSGTSTITLNPNSNLPAATVCDLTVIGSQVSDVDANDGPDLMAGTYVSSFTTS